MRRPDAARALRDAALPLRGGRDDDGALLDLIGDAKVVLLGEASHGTHEFYDQRAHITRRLITEKGFAAVAVEADWPDAYRVNRYVRGASSDASADEALGDFRRFPTWMWRNEAVREFVGWLRAHNDRHRLDSGPVGFYGLDLYSLHSSIEAVLKYLAIVDPEGAARARARYGCFDHFAHDPQHYGYSATAGLSESCEQEVVSQLVDLRKRAADYAGRDGRVARDDYFFAEQNARVVKNAEEYYRTMFAGHVESWNLRDTHMTETLVTLMTFLDQDRQAGGRARVVVWAHNSHLGDARATQMGTRGELNVGQLVRERFGADSVNVGFTTYDGTVTAASEWDAPLERKRVRPALAGSVEALFHDTGLASFFLPIRRSPEAATMLAEPRLERAIGVIYLPETERQSHYFYAKVADQFDAIVHVDRTRAVTPLERPGFWELEHDDVPETYPTGV